MLIEVILSAIWSAWTEHRYGRPYRRCERCGGLTPRKEVNCCRCHECDEEDLTLIKEAEGAEYQKRRSLGTIFIFLFAALLIIVFGISLLSG